MANAEHLEILKEGVEKWNEWRVDNPEIIPDLSFANLEGENLNGIDLSNSILVFTILIKSTLENANLEGAILNGAQLMFARLNSANLSSTNFGEQLSYKFKTYLSRTKETLPDTYLPPACLRCANLSKADLFLSDLTSVDLSHCFLNEVDFGHATLIGANLCDVTLNGAIFDNCSFGGTIFADTDLSVCTGLESVIIEAPCNIDFQTLRDSRNLPKSFLLKLGLPELYIDYLPDFYDDTLTLYSSFLSHSKENRAFARKLYEALIAKGVRVFFDEKELRPGDPLGKAIQKGINHFDKTILVCSEASLRSKWVDYELELAFKKETVLTEEKGDDVNLLIPITIDDYVFQWNGDKQPEVTGRFVGDFRGWEDDARFEAALNELILALNVNRREHIPPSFL